MATYNSTDWNKVKYNTQEVTKIILNGVTAWEEVALPATPLTLWSGNTNVNKGSKVNLTGTNVAFAKTGTVFKITAPDFGEILCTQQSNGNIYGTIYAVGGPVNGQYYVSMTPHFKVISSGTQVEFTATWFYEGTYPNASTMDDDFQLWITKIEVVSW